MGSLPRQALLVALLASFAARAQVSFIDGFEGSLTQFEVPPGAWDFIGLQYPMQSVVTDVAAFKRGTRGLRTIDNHRDAGVDTQVVLGRNISGMGSQFTRVWWRSSASSPVDARISFSMVQGNTNIGTLGELKWNPRAEEVRLLCFDRLSMFSSPGAAVSMPQDGGFRLVELAIQNVGSGGATCAFAVDGQERARQTVDLFNVQLGNILIGPVYGETEWTGVMDYDDFAASPMPMASKAAVTPSVVRTGRCEGLFLEPLSSFGGRAPVSSLTRVVVRVDGGTLFADPGCATAIRGASVVVLSQGSMGSGLFFRTASSSSVDVELVADDLVGSRQELVVIPDDAGVDAGLDGGPVDAGGGVDAGADDGGVDTGGVDAGGVDAGGVDAGGGDDGGVDAGGADAGASPRARGDYAVGCGCNAEGPVMAIGVALFLLVARRRHLKTS